ncbi:MAG: YidB family protein [Pseudomonadota bacterium]
MDIKEMAIKLAMQKLGGSALSGKSEDLIGNALSALTGDKNEGSFDIGDLVSQLQGGGLGGVLSSWLGDGSNEAVDGAAVADALGSDRIGEFASRLGLDQGQAADALSNLIPDLVDKSSEGGSLVGNLASLASRFLR